MTSYGDLRHVVVTPSRDESDFIPSLIESMTKQTVVPSEWVIVSHNSSESGKQILEEARKIHDWISVIYVEDNSVRKRGAQIAKLVNEGVSSIEIGWQYISKIDADMVLPSDYFEKIFSKFSESSGLGIASGSCFLIERGKRIVEVVADEHTRGGLKTYRKECFDDIGGIRDVDGWDGIDNAIAQMKGWETRCFLEIEAHHQRRTGAYSGLVRGCFESGKFAHAMRYYLPFIVARSIHRMLRKPFLIGGISMILGYWYGAVVGQPAAMEPHESLFLRNKQKVRMRIWRKQE